MTELAERLVRPNLASRPMNELTDAVTVQLVGGLSVSRNGRVLRHTAVGSRKARTVLAALAVQRGYVSVDHITYTVWGDDAPRDPVANVATLVSRLRGTLGASVIMGGRTGYRLSDDVRVDLTQAGDLVDEAAGRLATDQHGLALTTARRAAVILAGGDVLTEHPDMYWADSARAHQHQLLRQAWHLTAEAALRVGDAGTAQVAAEAAITADMFDEAASRLLMRAHSAAGDRARALLAYQRLRTVLMTELGVDPAPSTRELHLAILREGR